MVDAGDWILPGQVLGCAYPRRKGALSGLAAQGIQLLLNLHERAHDPARLTRYGLIEVHLPVPDFTAPTPAQLDQAIGTLNEAVATGQPIAVHCGGGLGRTGTVLAAFLVHQGADAVSAIDQVRRVRPGSIETRAQVAAVHAYANKKQGRSL
jgi:atypical dual specificity phosphatase